MGYELDLVSTDRFFLGALAEARITDFSVTLKAPGDTEFTSASGPLPAYGGIARAYLLPNMSVTASVSGFKLWDSLAQKLDATGNYVYPDGFDPATGEWLPGHEAAQAEWERQYAEAHARWETHRKQVAEQRKKDAEAIAAAAEAAGEAAADAPTSYSSPSNDEGALATDEALQALRDAGIKVKSESLVTMCFDAIRTPDELTTRE